jgi:hypothetical protein
LACPADNAATCAVVKLAAWLVVKLVTWSDVNPDTADAVIART